MRWSSDISRNREARHHWLNIWGSLPTVRNNNIWLYGLLFHFMIYEVLYSASKCYGARVCCGCHSLWWWDQLEAFMRVFVTKGEPRLEGAGFNVFLFVHIIVQLWSLLPCTASQTASCEQDLQIQIFLKILEREVKLHNCNINLHLHI